MTHQEIIDVLEAIDDADLSADLALCARLTVVMIKCIEEVIDSTGHPPDRLWLQQVLRELGVGWGA